MVLELEEVRLAVSATVAVLVVAQVVELAAVPMVVALVAEQLVALVVELVVDFVAVRAELVICSTNYCLNFWENFVTIESEADLINYH